MENMEADESAYLLCGKSIGAMRINSSKGRRKDPETTTEDFRYYSAQPVWMKIRLCLFWSLWALLVMVLIISILSYCCFPPQICTFDRYLRNDSANG